MSAATASPCCKGSPDRGVNLSAISMIDAIGPYSCPTIRFWNFRNAVKRSPSLAPRRRVACAREISVSTTSFRSGGSRKSSPAAMAWRGSAYPSGTRLDALHVEPGLQPPVGVRPPKPRDEGHRRERLQHPSQHALELRDVVEPNTCEERGARGMRR